MLHSRIEVSGDKFANQLFRGDATHVRAVMQSTHEIAVREMHQALDEIGAAAVANFVAVSPVGKGNPGTLKYGGHTPPRAAGTLRSSWSHKVHRVGGDWVLVVGSDDPVSEYIDKGTGRRSSGKVAGKVIRKGGVGIDPYYAVPADHLRIGGSHGETRRDIKDVRFLTAIRGTHAQHIVERALRMTRPIVSPTLRAAAKRAKRDIKAALAGR